MSERKPVRVVSVLDQYRCVINRGREDGISEGDRFIIFGLGDRIKDPDTGEDLGVLEIVRGRGKVVHLQARMATLETYEHDIAPGSRIIRRNPTFGLGTLLNDEIEEVRQPLRAVLQDVETGDFARPV